MANKRHSGFTLMELMITLVILAILVAIAAPSFSGLLERRKIQGAGDVLFADLMFAKTEAIKRNKEVWVTFMDDDTDGITWCYGLSIEAACDCTASDCTVDGVLKVTNQDDFSNVRVDISSTFANDNPADFTAFSPLRGGVTQSGTLEFINSSGTTMLGVVVSPIVGRIRMCGDSFGYGSC